MNLHKKKHSSASPIISRVFSKPATPRQMVNGTLVMSHVKAPNLLTAIETAWFFLWQFPPQKTMEFFSSSLHKKYAKFPGENYGATVGISAGNIQCERRKNKKNTPTHE